MTANKKNLPLAEAFTSFLRDRKMRLTSERLAVTEAIARCPDMFTVDDICGEVAQVNIRMSRATVYNTVDLLCEASLVNAFSIPGQSGVTYKVAGTPGVQIFKICDKCGKIKASADHSIDSAITGHALRGFAPRAVTLNIYGLCPRCARGSKKK